LLLIIPHSLSIPTLTLHSEESVYFIGISEKPLCLTQEADERPVLIHGLLDKYDYFSLRPDRQIRMADLDHSFFLDRDALSNYFHCPSATATTGAIGPSGGSPL
jgi:hypothetical protein